MGKHVKSICRFFHFLTICFYTVVCPVTIIIGWSFKTLSWKPHLYLCSWRQSWQASQSLPSPQPRESTQASSPLLLTAQLLWFLRKCWNDTSTFCFWSCTIFPNLNPCFLANFSSYYDSDWIWTDFEVAGNISRIDTKSNISKNMKLNDFTGDHETHNTYLINYMYQLNHFQ